MSRHIDFERHNPECRFDQLVDELALHDPLYIARVRASDDHSKNQVATVTESGNQVFDGTRQKTHKQYQNVQQAHDSNTGAGSETLSGMRYRVSQLENQVKQLKANNEALKAKTGAVGTRNSFKKPWNNSGKQPGNSKGKKNVPSKRQNQKFTDRRKLTNSYAGNATDQAI